MEAPLLRAPESCRASASMTSADAAAGSTNGAATPRRRARVISRAVVSPEGRSICSARLSEGVGGGPPPEELLLLLEGRDEELEPAEPGREELREDDLGGVSTL